MSPKKKRSKSSFFLSKSSPRKTPEKQKQKPKKKNLNKIVEILSQTQQAKSGKKKQEEATSVEMMSKEQKVKSMDKPKKKTKCGTCPNCIKANCGSCTNCQDMKMFGGPGKSKQSCKMRKCLLFGSSLKNSSISALAASSTSVLASSSISVLVRVFYYFFNSVFTNLLFFRTLSHQEVSRRKYPFIHQSLLHPHMPVLL